MAARHACPWLCLSALLYAVGVNAQRVDAQGVRGDGIAAVVGGATPGPGTDVVLHSDVDLRARIRRLQSSPGEIPRGPLPDAELAVALQEIIGEVLISREADRVRVAIPDEGDVAEQRARLAQSVGGAERLSSLVRSLSASPREIDVMALRRARAQVFLEANLEGVSVVTDSQVEQAYEAGDHPFVGQPLEEVRESLRAWLSQQAVERAVRRWVGVLRGRTTVRILAEYGEGTT